MHFNTICERKEENRAASAMCAPYQKKKKKIVTQIIKTPCASAPPKLNYKYSTINTSLPALAPLRVPLLFSFSLHLVII
jgi:hypothetical protein